MDYVILLLRLLHIVLGAFWFGAVMLFTFFVLPSIAEAGPAGGQVMAGMARRRYLDIMPVTGVLTILSGFALYWRDSAGFTAPWVQSMASMAYLTGAVAAIATLTVGLSIMRPGAAKVTALMAKAAATAEGPERAALLAEAGTVRARTGRAGLVTATLLTIATVMMALARYL